MRNLFVLLLLATGFSVAAQDSMVYKNVVSLAPLRLFGDANNPGVELAWEHRYKPRRSVQVVGAYLVPLGNKKSGMQNFRGLRLGVDHRFYNGRNPDLFTAVGIVYNHARFLYAGQYEHNNGVSSNDTTHLTRTSAILSISTGIQIIAARRFSFDVAFGLGLKYRQVTQREEGFLLSHHTDWADFQSFYRPGTVWTVAFPLQLRFGYRF